MVLKMWAILSGTQDTYPTIQGLLHVIGMINRDLLQPF